MEDKVNQNLEGLIDKLENFITTKTVVGEPIHIDNTILVPLVDVSFGAASGSVASNKFIERKKEKEKKVDGDSGAGAGGLGAKITPSAMLVIQNGTTQLINIKAQDGLTKLIDMIPGLISKIPDTFSKATKEHKTHQKSDADVYHDLDDEVQ